MNIKELIENARFGSRFVTTEGKEAVFLRYAENAEHKFAIFYVKDWGTVQVFRSNGRECHGEIKYDIIGRKACDDDITYCHLRHAIHKVGETSLYFESANGRAFPQTEESIGSLIDASLASHLLKGEELCDIEVFIRRKTILTPCPTTTTVRASDRKQGK